MSNQVTNWLIATSGVNVSGALAANAVVWGTPANVGASGAGSVAIPAVAMSATVSVTNWLVGNIFQLGTTGPLAGLTKSQVSAVGFEVRYSNPGFGDGAQFNQKVCGLSLVVSAQGATGTSAVFVGTDHGWDVCANFATPAAHVTAGSPTDMWGMSAKDNGNVTGVTANMWNNDKFGFAFRVKVSGTGGTTRKAAVQDFEIRFYYAYPDPQVDSAEFGFDIGRQDSVNSRPVSLATDWRIPDTTYAAVAGLGISAANQVTALDSAYASNSAFGSTNLGNGTSWLFSETLGYNFRTNNAISITNATFEVVYKVTNNKEIGAGVLNQNVSADTSAPITANVVRVKTSGVVATAVFTLTSAITSGAQSLSKAFVESTNFRFLLGVSAVGPSDMSVDRIQGRINYVFGYTNDIGLGLNFGVQSDEFGWEGGSPGFIYNGTTNVFGSEFGFEVIGDTATSARSSPWIYPVTAISLSANISEISASHTWRPQTGAVGSANNAYASALSLVGGTVWLASFYSLTDLGAPSYTVIVSGAEIRAGGFAGGAFSSARFTFVSSNSLATTQYPTGVKFVGTVVTALQGGVCANVTAGSPTTDWGTVSAGRFPSLASQKFGVAYRFQTAVGTGNIDTIAFKLSYTYIPSRDVGLTDNEGPQPAEFGWEVATVRLITNGGVQTFSEEFDFEAGSPSMTPIYNVGVQSAEFGWEAGSPPLSQVQNLTVQSAEFGYEVATVQMILNVGIVSSEFGWETNSPVLGNNVGVQSAEFGWEAGSPSFVHNLNVTNAEFGWESTQPRFGLNLGINNAEFGWETDTVHFVVVSPVLVGNAEFGWECEGGVGVRRFIKGRPIPSSRVKYVRQI